MIIGANGFVGRNLSRHFSNRPASDVLLTHHATPPSDHSLPSIALDVLDPDAIGRALDTHRPDWIINAAGNKNVRFCEENPGDAQAINAEAAGTIAAACAERGDMAFAHVSSDLVFGGDRGDYGEDEIPVPATVYGKSKLAGERLALDAHPESLIVRTGGVYGHDSPLLGWLRGELAEGRSVECFEDVRNTPTYAENLAEIIEAALTQGLTGVLHAVGRESSSRYDLFAAFAEVTGLDGSLLIPCDAGVRRKEMLLAADSSLSSDATRARLPEIVFNTAREGFERLTEGGAEH
jgi:dTDP-4-dehydrorhamnose reductase